MNVFHMTTDRRVMLEMPRGRNRTGMKCGKEGEEERGGEEEERRKEGESAGNR